MHWTLILLALNIFAALLAQESTAAQAIDEPATITIAVIDTGIDPDHPALKDSLWENPGETGRDRQGRDKSTNGVDDDRNGYIDDVHGFSFANGNNDIEDHHGHGTHIAGIIHKTAPNAKIMVVKYFDPRAKGSENLANLIKALRYANQMNAQIINYSGGGFIANPEERRAIQDSQRKGILVIAAAGNESSNSDREPFYPADYGLSNILSVTAHDSNGELLSSANFGQKSVALAAPGLKIVSTLPQGQWGEMSGTSQATAFASGAAARLLEQRPDWVGQPEILIRHLMLSTHFQANLVGKTASSGALDLSRSQAIQDHGRTFSGYRLSDDKVLDPVRRPAARRDAIFPIQ